MRIAFILHSHLSEVNQNLVSALALAQKALDRVHPHLLEGATHPLPSCTRSVSQRGGLGWGLLLPRLVHQIQNRIDNQLRLVVLDSVASFNRNPQSAVC
jgi:hypothetical protein